MNSQPLTENFYPELNFINLKNMIGISEDLTDKSLNKIKLLEPSSSLLSIYSLFLLDRYHSTIPILKNLMEKDLSMSIFESLQQSQYYLHRKAFSEIIQDISSDNQKVLFKKLLNDKISKVI